MNGALRMSRHRPGESRKELSWELANAKALGQESKDFPWLENKRNRVGKSQRQWGQKSRKAQNLLRQAQSLGFIRNAFGGQEWS